SCANVPLFPARPRRLGFSPLISLVDPNRSRRTIRARLTSGPCDRPRRPTLRPTRPASAAHPSCPPPECSALSLTPASASFRSAGSLTHPRSNAGTRGATWVADWFKARRFDKLVAVLRNSPLRQLFLGGGQPFTELAQEALARLYELFRPEVEELEVILNRDF